MKNISEFVDEWGKEPQRAYSEHIDFFISKDTFNYEDCLMVMQEVKKELHNKGNYDTKVMVRIQCGQSERIQNWGELFWKLVDTNLIPPEVYIGSKDYFSSSVFKQKLNHQYQIDTIENYIVFYPVEEGFIRCLDLVEKEVNHG